MILLGFITSPLLDLIGSGIMELFSCLKKRTASKAPDDDETGTSKPMEFAGAKAPLDDLPVLEDDAVHKAATRRRIIGGIIIGDFMHNFCDGVFIGSAFAFCGPTLGWSVAMGTIFHEIAQEISDFCILTNPKQGGLNPWVAMIFNFVSGMSVILGVIIMFSLDVSETATGMLLAYGGGVYVHIGSTECMSRVYQQASTLFLRFMWLLSFVVGAAAIGLVLLDHEHCSTGGGHGHHHH